MVTPYVISTLAYWLLLGLALPSSALPGQHTPVYDVPTQDCFWAPAVSSDPNWNYVFPDSNAIYQCSSFHWPEGAELHFEATFPRARSISWNLYGGEGGDNLIDQHIIPSAGSENPFMYGANRHTERRSYSLRAVDMSRPKGATVRAANTLYRGGSTRSSFGNFLCVRIYVPDEDALPFGGSKLPRVTVMFANGTKLQGQAMCDAVDAMSSGNAVPAHAMGFNLSQYLSLRDPPGQNKQFPAMNPPEFKAFFNTRHQMCAFFTPWLDCGNPVYNPDGVGLGNPNNRYVETWVDQGYGKVLVLRAKLPRTPRTWKGNAVVPKSEYDLRYFSICPQESLATWRVGDCLFDEEMPTDDDGYYTVVLSAPSYKPTNAEKECGVGWVPLPPAGDGAGDVYLSNVWIRFMLPSDGFKEAAQRVEHPGTEKEVMGSYYPVGKYMSTEQFEAYGCRVSELTSVLV